MPEPVPPESVSAGGVPEFVPRTPVWPVLAVLLSLAGIGTFFAIKAQRAPRPLRVLVAVDVDGYWWEGSQPAAALSDTLGTKLAKLGFDPVKAGDPEVTKVLEKAKSPEEAARALHAAYIITARVAPEVIEHVVQSGGGPDGKYFEVRGGGDVVVRHISHSSDGQPITAGHVHGFAGAKSDATRARTLLAVDLADQTFDLAVPRLLADPEMKEELADRKSTASTALAPARDWLEQRERHLKKASDAWETVLRERLEKETGAKKPVYLSAAGAHDELAGVGPNGALVSTNDVKPFYFADSKGLGFFHQLETLEWRAPDGTKKTMWQGYNFFGYPGVAPSGASAIVIAVVIEDLFGWAKTITVITSETGAQGKPKRVRVDPSHRFLDPRVAPGGKLAAMYDRPCADCPSAFLVSSLVDGKDVFRVEHEEGHFGGYTWLDATHVAILHTATKSDDGHTLVPPKPTTPPGSDDKNLLGRQGVYVIDCAASPAAIVERYGIPLIDVLTMPSASPKGDLIAFEHREGKRAIALLRRPSGELVDRALPGHARSPTFSPDGSELAFELLVTGTQEIAVVSVTEGEPRVLTRNPFRDRYPLFSTDGTKIFYESLGDDPNFPQQRSLSIVAWVAAR